MLVEVLVGVQEKIVTGLARASRRSIWRPASNDNPEGHVLLKWVTSGPLCSPSMAMSLF
jgi:hypothetical protein